MNTSRKKQTAPTSPDWLTYEQRKQAWEHLNPNATPQERDEAIRRILDGMGL